MSGKYLSALLVVAAMGSLFSNRVFAQDAAAPAAPSAEEKKSYDGTAEVSALVTNGNTKNQTTGLAFEVNYRPDPWLVGLKAKHLATISQEVQTQESYESIVRAGRKITDWFDIFVEHTYFKNRFSGVDHRHIGSVGLGYFLIQSDAHNLKTELLVGHTSEQRIDGTSLSFMSGGGSLLYKWKISPSSDFTHETKYQPNFQTADDWRLVSETGVSAAISSMFSSKVSWKYEHVNLPPAGKLKGDTTTMVSLLAKF